MEMPDQFSDDDWATPGLLTRGGTHKAPRHEGRGRATALPALWCCSASWPHCALPSSSSARSFQPCADSSTFKSTHHHSLYPLPGRTGLTRAIRTYSLSQVSSHVDTPESCPNGIVKTRSTPGPSTIYPDAQTQNVGDGGSYPSH